MTLPKDSLGPGERQRGVIIKNHQWPVRNVRAEFINKENPPVSTMVEVSRLAIDGMLIEVEVVALLP